MSPNCNTYFASVAMSCLMAVVAPTANATLLLSGSINGTNFCASDQNVGCGFGGVIPDGNPAVNQLGLNVIIINGVQVFGSLHDRDVRAAAKRTEQFIPADHQYQ